MFIFTTMDFKINNLNLKFMKKNTPLSQKLAGYTAFAAALTGFASSADAQIVHVDNSDAVIGLNGTQNFDLDGDGNDDVNFWQIHSFSPPGSSSTFGSSSQNSAILTPLSPSVSILGNGIGVQYLFSNDIIQVDDLAFGNQNNLDYFAGLGEKFVGIKFDDGVNNYVGWIRISVGPNSTSITVLDWAYSSYTTPTTSIKAGQTSGVATSLTHDALSSLLNVSVAPTKVTNKLSINTSCEAKYQVANINGIIISQGELVSGENTIDVSLLAKGIYLVKIDNKEGSIVKRIIKD